MLEPLSKNYALCDFCGDYAPALLVLKCECGETDKICPDCLRVVADNLETGNPLGMPHEHVC